MYFFIKILLSALIIAVVSEIGKRYTWSAAILISLPLTSILAFVWLYLDTRDVQKIIDLSLSTIIMTVPSIIFFIILPIMLKLKYNFSLSMVVALASTSLFYIIFITIIKKINFNF